MDDTQQKLDLEMRLSAIEFVVANLVNEAYRAAGLSEAAIAESEERLFATLSIATLSPLRDPALADHLSAELNAKVAEILLQSHRLRASPAFRLVQQE